MRVMRGIGLGGSALVVAGVAACSSGLLSELSTVPTGVPVVLSTAFTPGVTATTGSISGKGDSVVALVTRPATCGRTETADAGSTSAGIVITISLTSTGVQNCTPLNGMTTYRAVVHGIAPGVFNASAHVRVISNGANADTTAAEATIRLP